MSAKGNKKNETCCVFKVFVVMHDKVFIAPFVANEVMHEVPTFNGSYDHGPYSVWPCELDAQSITRQYNKMYAERKDYYYPRLYFYLPVKCMSFEVDNQNSVIAKTDKFYF